jgi:hypothetical protein
MQKHTHASQKYKLNVYTLCNTKQVTLKLLAKNVACKGSCRVLFIVIHFN